MRFSEIISENKKPGLWANIHAKRDRIKNGSGEHMRKPGSKGAPTADALKKSATDEAANPKRQAAIAIAMKKAGKKPKTEGYAMEDEQIDGMAQGEIREIIKNAIHIKNQLDKGVSLDGWMYSFVTVSNDKLNSVAEQINNPNIEEQGVAEGSTETTQQQQVRAAISKGLEVHKQKGDAEYKTRLDRSNKVGTVPGHYFDNTGYASDKLTGIDSIDPDGTVVTSLNDTDAEGWVKKLATLGGMPGVKTRALQSPTASSKGVAEGSKEDMSKEVKAMATGTCPHCHGPVKKKEHPTLTQYHCAKCGIRGSIDKQGVAEGLNEGIGGNYLYHATDANGLKGMLSSGSIRSATSPQAATSAQTKLPTVSVTRDWGYASGSNASNQMAGIGRDAILVLDRNAVESNFKTLGTSQSTNIKGLAFNPYLKKDGEARSQNTDPMARTNAKGKAKYAEPTAKAGGEFEEAVVVPKGSLPLKGTMVGFWINPKSKLMQDPAIMNDPRRLDMPRPNQFVKAEQQQGVAEGLEQQLVTIYTNPAYKGATVDDRIKKSLPVTEAPFNKLQMWENGKSMKDPKVAQWVNNHLLPQLKQNGKLGPLVVWNNKGKLFVIDGNHRFIAYQAAGYNGNVPVQIVPDKMINIVDTVPGQQGVAEGLPGGFSKSDYMPGATVKNPNTSCKRCNGRGTLWKAPDGKILPANDVPGAKKYKCGACDGIGMAKKEVDEGENWSKHNNKRAGGMSKKSVASYRRSHPGSKIQTAVTTKPSKLKKGSKAAARRKSFCARMRGMKKHRTGAKTAHDPNSNINKSLRRWHCESIEELHELVMLAEQYIRNNKK